MPKIKDFTENEKYNIIKTICPNTTECISFGTQSDEIRQLFGEFKIPSNLINKNEIKQIGEKSAMMLRMNSMNWSALVEIR